MAIYPITDIDDPRLAAYRNVPDAELLRERGLFVAEGRLVVRRLLESSRFAARSVMVTDTAFRSLEDLLTPSLLPVFVVSQAALNDITGFNIHRGCLALGERGAPADWRTLAAAARCIMLVERLANADNVGSIFRNAAAFGADGVLLDALSTDPLYRKAIRTSMGAALALPFARVDHWPAAVTELRGMGYAVIALTPRANATIDEVAAVVRGRRVALVLGHEGEGLADDTVAACEWMARIPMSASVDSLNVATAAAIALYEVSR